MSDRPSDNPQDPSTMPLRLEAAPPRRRAVHPRDDEDPDYLGRGVEGPRLDSVRLMEYVRMLYKRRWIAASVFVLIMAGTVLHTFSQIPVYEARVRLLVEPERQIPGSRTLVDDEAAALIDFQTQHAIVNSHTFARKAMEALNIWDPAAFAAAHPPQAKRGISGAILSARRLIGEFAGRNGTPVPVPVLDSDLPPDTPQSQAGRIGAFLSGVRVTPVPQSRLIEITYTSTRPEQAAAYANAIARQYIDQNLEFKFLAAKEASDWLAERLVEQRRRVEAAEQAVHAYRQKNQVVASTDERVKASIQRLGELTTAVTRAKTERIEKETTYSRLRAAGDRAALEATPEVASNPVVLDLKSQLAAATKLRAQLAETLLPKHPNLMTAQRVVETTQARLDAAVDNAVKVVRGELQAAQAAESSLVQVYEQQKRDAMRINQSDVEFAVLQRDFESNRQIYDAMLQRARESDVAGAPKTNNIRILDPAEVPRVPSGSGRARLLRNGALAGLGMAFVLVWFFEYIDNRVTSPADIQHLGLPFLGFVPTVPAATAHALLLTRDPSFQFAESLRSIRTNVLFSSAHEGPRSVVVTSAHSGDGKTVVSSNLAVSLAQAGQRVLLIDGDLRRPRMHDVFEVAQEPGLSNLMVGNAAAADVIRPTSVTGLCVMPAGRVPPNPAELLGSKRFVEFMARLEAHFDWVVIDSTPVIPVTDPTVLSHTATAAIMVVSAEKTSRHGAREAIDRLEAAGAHVMGIVLNQVDLSSPYYYARQYKTYYAPYESAAGVRAR